MLSFWSPNLCWTWREGWAERKYGCVSDLLSLDAFSSPVGLCLGPWFVRETALLRNCGIAPPAVGFWVVVDGSVSRTAGTGCCQQVEDAAC